MKKVKLVYQVLFWVFVFFFVFDYLAYEYELLPAIGLTLTEVVIYAFVFYSNLMLLIPRLLISRGKVMYSMGVLLLLVLIYLPYDWSGLGNYLIGDVAWRNLISFSLNYILFIVISLLYWYFIQYRQEHQNRMVLKNEKLQAELLLFKSQVSPHFLFNSLNNIYSLSIVKHDNATVMIEKLSDILRYIIYEGNKELVPLAREVELLTNYVDLQLLKKLKAGKNVSFTCVGVLPSHQIVPLVLINLIENSFKHSDIGYNEKGFLEIKLMVINNQLTFSTLNSFKPSLKKAGIGLTNVEQQLHHYYPLHRLHIDQQAGIFKVELQLDLIKCKPTTV